MAAYYIISSGLFYFLYKRRDVPFRWMFVLFGLFILACGTTHLMGIWTVWNPDCWMDGTVKALTAMLSFSTGLLLFPLIPKAMALRSPTELEEANAKLMAALREREEAFNLLQQSQSQLLRRTEELTQQRRQLRHMATELTLIETKERQRLAIELHDHLQQLLVLSKLKLGQGKHLIADPTCSRLIADTDECLADALKYTRTLVAELSPPVLRDHGLLAFVGGDSLNGVTVPLNTRHQDERWPVTTSQPDVANDSDNPPDRKVHTTIRVVIVDDHTMVRQGLRAILENRDNIEIIGEASDVEEAVEAVHRFKPEVVLMDINMPTKNGIQATTEIKASYPNIAIIGLTVNPSSANETAMLQAGECSVLSKEAAVEHLYGAMLAAMKSAPND